jgi:hypothetical protein
MNEQLIREIEREGYGLRINSSTQAGYTHYTVIADNDTQRLEGHGTGESDTDPLTIALQEVLSQLATRPPSAVELAEPVSEEPATEVEVE